MKRENRTTGRSSSKRNQPATLAIRQLRSIPGITRFLITVYMREQGIAANATSRVIRGRNKGKVRDGAFRALRRGKSNAIRAKVTTIATELAKNGGFSEPARASLIETRKAVVANWMKIAETLDRQGEVALAGDVRYFAKNLPPVRTDTERLAAQFVRHLARSRSAPPREREQLNRDASTR